MDVYEGDELVVASEQLQDGFTPSEIASTATEAGPVLAAHAPYLPVIAESICDRGPCRRLHLLRCAVDAEEGTDGASGYERPKLGPDGQPIVKYREPDVLNWEGKTVPGREIYETEPYVPSEEKRLCYPQPGVRIELSRDIPVLECSLWDPEDPHDAEGDAYHRRIRRMKYEQRERESDATRAQDAPDIEDLNRDESIKIKRKK